MKKKNLIKIVGLFLFIIISLRICWIVIYMKWDDPKANRGVLDLRELRLEERSPILLDGEWVFYPNEFVDPQINNKKLVKLSHSLIKVPSDWRSLETNTGLSPYGYGTYRLQILLNQHTKQPLALYLKEIRSASSIYINGKKIYEKGKVTNSSKDSIPDYNPFKINIGEHLKEIDLIIHVSNFQSFYSGGITKPIQLGTVASIDKERTSSFFKEFMVSIVLFIHGVYAIIIFILFRRKKELFYLSLAFFCAAISVLVDDDMLLIYLFPAISFHWWFKLHFFSYVGSVLFLILFLKNSRKDSIARKFSIAINFFTCLCIVYILLLICVTDLSKMLINTILFALIIYLAAVLIPSILWKTVTKLNSGFIYLLLGAISLAVNTLWGAAKINFIEISYYPFDFIISVICFALFWFNSFFQITDDRKRLVEKLQKEDKRKDEFLANTSHELRNPLHGILNIAQTIYESGKKTLNDENKKNLRVLISVSKRMSLILNDLLDISKLKEEKISLQKEAVDLSSVVLAVFDMLQFMVEEKKVSFKMEIPNELPNLFADENRLFQILFNLIHNAVKYSNEGDILVSAQEKNGWVHIHVKDKGIGIDEETLKFIFNPYAQADTNMKAFVGGIGLGLSICEQLVKLHGGKITVESSIGKGSIFTFTLPVTNDPILNSNRSPIKRIELVERINVEKTLTSKNTENQLILVVDDDPVNLSILESILSVQYKVITCTNGEDALCILKRERCDLVISDVMMPNMSGYELAQKIREKFSISELPILLLTARHQIEDIQTAFYYGANDYVIKPVEKQELNARINALIDLKISINERIRMEAAWLQAQINPHFLFNTLNTIAALSEVNPTKMINLLNEFGTFLHASFNPSNLDQLVPIENELELVRSYVYIQKERFEDRLHVEWDIDSDLNVCIPPLSIQTIVENAIKHGILKKSSGGTVQIKVIKQDKYVEVKIVDNGVGMSIEKQRTLFNNQKKQSRGIGLLNTNNRLKQHFGIGLHINSTINVGTTVYFKVTSNDTKMFL